MREIKFRGKLKYGAPGEWVFGPLFKSLDDVEGKEVEIMGIDIDDGTYPVDPATVGQYTGLKDANGREIYEGDICKLPSGNIGLVIWDKGLAGFVMCDDEPGDTIEFSSCTIIGNVHDNPEILEDDGWVRGDDDGL